MNRHSVASVLFHAFVLIVLAVAVNGQVKPARDPNQAIDQEYTRKIREYTTETSSTRL